MAAINTAWVDTLTAQINAVPDCRSLQQLINQIDAMMQEQLNNLIAQIENLSLLIIAPTNLTQVISYIGNLVAQYELQYAQALAMQAALIAAYTNLLTAINDKIANLSCTITPPTPPVLPP